MFKSSASYDVVAGGRRVCRACNLVKRAGVVGNERQDCHRISVVWMDVNAILPSNDIENSYASSSGQTCMGFKV